MTTPIDAHPTTPLDITRGSNAFRSVGFSQAPQERQFRTLPQRHNSDSSDDSTTGINRKPRFAEATAVVSPITGPGDHRLPFSRQPKMASASQSKPSDFGFGYISDNNPVEQQATITNNYQAGGQPLKSAMKTPGAQTRFVNNPLSPTFREEQLLEKEEELTEKQQAKDLKVKTRVRMAKMVLRGVNFSCSLIVLSMLSTTLTIFRATKDLPPRNNLPAWAPGTETWPQIVVLVISSISLFFSVVVIIAYCKGGHKKAQKVSLYYTLFAVGWFIFSIIMWMVGVVVLQGTKVSGGGQDLWGWSCKDNKRRLLFQDDIHYSLVCRLQDWSLICCIIEIVVEIIVIAIYGVVFYRYYSKHKLRQSMDARDRARSDLYLAQLRSQSAPNTPGFAMTPRNPYFPAVSDQKVDPYSAAEQGQSQPQYATVTPVSATTSSPFRLQAPPVKMHHPTPKLASTDHISPVVSASTSPAPVERFNDHVQAAPGEQVYESVPIPGAYQQTGPGQAY